MHTHYKKYRVLKSTLFDQVHAVDRPAPVRRPLTQEDEDTIVQTLMLYAHTGMHHTLIHLSEAVCLLVRSFSADWRARLPFKKDTPGIKFM